MYNPLNIRNVNDAPVLTNISALELEGDFPIISFIQAFTIPDSLFEE
jgi:hypothetical protein